LGGTVPTVVRRWTEGGHGTKNERVRLPAAGRAIRVELILRQLASERGVERIDDLPEEEQMKVVQRCGFKTKKEVLGLLDKWREAVEERKDERTRH
jgi:hypothetical protein